MRSVEWRLLRTEAPHNPHYNIAVEEAITFGGRFPVGTIRFWRNANAVVVGRFQCIANEVNITACSNFDTKIVRRFTGGGTVYHDLGNLNYTMVAPKGFSNTTENPAKTFHTIGQVFKRTLRILGIEARFVPKSESIDVNGRKISGMAATNLKGIILVHGSLLVSSNIERMSQVLNKNPKSPIKYTQSQRTSVTRISDELQQDIDIEEVEEILTTSFEEILDIELEKGGLSSEEEFQASLLYRSKYATHAWQVGECWPCVNALSTKSIQKLELLCVPAEDQGKR